jgi:hypothetical protein
MNTISCPHCGKDVEISQAFAHQLREQIKLEQHKLHKDELEKTKLEAEERALKKAKETLELKIKNSEAEIEETSQRNKLLQEQILEMTKEFRELKQKDGERQIELQKQLLKERERMEIEIGKAEQDRSRLEKAELQKKLDDTQKALEDAQRKASQTSQQLQGEVLELELEDQLRENFPTDDITPVPKGIEGADLVQTVKNKFGQTAGIILWETKRTKSWGGDWTAKLRENKRKIDASVAIIVSEVLPKGIENFGFYENVWVANYLYALPLANVLRMGLFELAIAKATSVNKDERLEALYNYLVKDGFRNKFEAQVEGIIAMKSDLETEQRSTVRLWKKREIELRRLMNNVAMMYGELQGILGTSLPTIQSLESPSLLESKTTQESLLE